MYTIAGATGQVGGAAARQLLADGAPVRVVVRDPSKGEGWAAHGADVAVADLQDRIGLRAAMAGSDGAFVLLPFDPAADDSERQTTARVDAIAGAVTDSEVPHVVVLSSYGADLPEGTGPIVGLHRLEEALRATGATVTAIRSAHFQEKVTDVLDAARHERIYPVFASSADVPKPMVATPDIGEVVAQTLRSAPAASEVVDLDGPAYTERQVAELLGTALGYDLAVVTIPRPGWVEALVGAGLPHHIATVLAGLHDADERGLLAPRGDRLVRCTTELETTLARLVGVPA
jgi:uncharacterized protein YbjT (DUF2867 family)